jgi:hypothetical protein
VASKHEKKVIEKQTDYRHAAIVHADVKAFEDSKKDRRKEHERVVLQHRESLMKQIDEHKNMRGIKGVMAPQEFALNKRIIEEVEGISPPDSPVKRPF